MNLRSTNTYLNYTNLFGVHPVFPRLSMGHSVLHLLSDKDDIPESSATLIKSIKFATRTEITCNLNENLPVKAPGNL